MKKTLIIERDDLVTSVARPADLEVLTNPQLLSIYNAATARSTSKFATRAKGVQQTFDAINNLIAVDLRVNPPMRYAVGDELPEVVRTPVASGSIPPEAARTQPVEPGSTEEVTEQVIPASRPAGKVGRPPNRQAARKQKDGTYHFDMDPRAPRGKTMGGRRPELAAMLRKRPTFKQLLSRYKPNGETDEQRAFNLATAMTCMGHVAGFGFRTEADGRITLLEPLL